MTATTISGISDLGTVYLERNRISNSVITLNVPLSATDKAQTINLMGKRRIVTISGIFTGDPSTISIFIDDIEDWVNSGIQTTRTYTNTFGKSYSVICTEFEYEYTLEAVAKIDYVIQLIEGGFLSNLL